jgi:hypothetical protein
MFLESACNEARTRLALAEKALNEAGLTGGAMAIRAAIVERDEAAKCLKSIESCVYVPCDDPHRNWQNLYAIWRRITADISERNGLRNTAIKKKQEKAIAMHTVNINELTKVADFYAHLVGEAEAFYRAYEEEEHARRCAEAKAARAARYALDMAA